MSFIQTQKPVFLEKTAGSKVQLLSTTGSVCPACLVRIPARRVARGEDVYLEKSCPEHGDFQTILWRGRPDYQSWARPKTPAYPRTPFTPVDRGCPFDCGLCPDHRQQTCTALLEVTRRCSLRCPVCFADAGGRVPPDPDLAVIEGWYRRLLDAGGPYNIQLSGGEPTMRADLPRIVGLGRSRGFTFIQINTNGLRLAGEPGYARQLREAGLSSIFLQFDGVSDEIYQKLRGAPLLAYKQQAVERCTEAGLGVILVPTLVPGVNTGQIGDIIEFAVQHAPAVRGVHFQPISYFGRYPQPPTDA
ncbi:MAG: radical SAM protein, partial [Chloroflexota bacterium]